MVCEQRRRASEFGDSSLVHDENLVTIDDWSSWVSWSAKNRVMEMVSDHALVSIL